MNFEALCILCEGCVGRNSRRPKGVTCADGALSSQRREILHIPYIHTYYQNAQIQRDIQQAAFENASFPSCRASLSPSSNENQRKRCSVKAQVIIFALMRIRNASIRKPETACETEPRRRRQLAAVANKTRLAKANDSHHRARDRMSLPLSRCRRQPKIRLKPTRCLLFLSSCCVFQSVSSTSSANILRLSRT